MDHIAQTVVQHSSLRNSSGLHGTLGVRSMQTIILTKLIFACKYDSILSIYLRLYSMFSYNLFFTAHIMVSSDSQRLNRIQRIHSGIPGYKFRSTRGVTGSSMKGERIYFIIVLNHRLLITILAVSTELLPITTALKNNKHQY